MKKVLVNKSDMNQYTMSIYVSEKNKNLISKIELDKFDILIYNNVYNPFSYVSLCTSLYCKYIGINNSYDISKFIELMINGMDNTPQIINDSGFIDNCCSENGVSVVKTASYLSPFGINIENKYDNGNIILRKIIYPFFNYWDNLSFFEKFETKIILTILFRYSKQNNFQYYFYKLCDPYLITDVGDKSYKLMKKTNLCDVRFIFN